jgi:polysaccharide export outer membrane protein
MSSLNQPTSAIGARSRWARITLRALLPIALISISEPWRLGAQQSPGSNPPLATRSVPVDGAAPPADYAISPDDLLEVAVFDVPEMSRVFRVHSSGKVVLPLVREPIKAAGLTTDQLSAAIASRLRDDGLVSEPQVTVEVKESRLHSVVVAGEVKKPQIYPIFGETRLLDVLAQAEGLADNAGTVAVVSRGNDTSCQSGQEQPGEALVVDLKRLMESNDPRLNLRICAGDRVTVQQAGIVYVVGAVNRPGGFVLNAAHEPMTVLKAVALAENLKPTAVGNNARVLHRQSSGAGEEGGSPVKLKDILSGHAPDLPLHADDILFVPDSNSQRVLRRAAEAAVQAATGVIIWRLP